MLKKRMNNLDLMYVVKVENTNQLYLIVFYLKNIKFKKLNMKL